MSNFDGINYNSNTPIFNAPPVKPKKRRFWKWFLVFLVLIVGTIAVGGAQILSKTNQIFTNKQNIFTRFGKLIIPGEDPLKGEENGKVNILLLGMGGPGHEGPYLTDTMIVASIDTKTKEVVLTSIPRDFLVQLPGRGFNKVNAAYAYAEQNEVGSGGEAAIAQAEKITGLEIPYYAAVDFKGFVKAVDHVGGLDITIDRTFTDSQYPNYNLGYLPPVTFSKGQEHMDGERALIFARSRKGNNGEGSDFARSERQKKIMLAFKDEVMQLNLSDLGTINNLLSDFTENFRTNFSPEELKRLSSIAKDISSANVYNFSLEPDNNYICDGLIDMNTGRPAPPPAPVPSTDDEDETNTPTVQENAITRIYVVLPCDGKSLADINNYMNKSLAYAKLRQEAAVIEIVNTTGKSYVLDDWRALSEAGVTLKFSSSKTAIERTILYNNSEGSKPKTLEYLKSNYNLATSDLPYTQSTADFVIILGQYAL